MNETLLQLVKRIEEEKRLREAGIEMRKPVYHCAACRVPMFQSPISADDPPDADPNPLSDVPR